MSNEAKSGNERQTLKDDIPGAVTAPGTGKMDPVAYELGKYTYGKTLSDAARKRLVEETDEDRLTEDRRNGQDDSGLYLAWLRS